MAEDCILELRRVSKAFSSHQALSSVSLGIPRGSFFSLLGPSGCGKTTTLRLIGGFETPTSGEIRLGGLNVNGLKPYERDVSTVFQNYALFPHLSALENVEFGLRERRVRDRATRALKALELVELASKRDCRPAHLSGGEKQRVALARSLVLEPSRRDSAMAVAVAAVLAQQRDAAATVLILAADQVVHDAQAFVRACHEATAAAAGIDVQMLNCTPPPRWRSW